jgi:integrase
MPIVKLTQDLVTNGLKCPPGKTRAEWCDYEQPGLLVEARASGRSTFYIRYTSPLGATCYKRLGATSELSLVDARKRAKLLKAEISLGADPRADTKKQEAVITFDRFFVDHYLPYVKSRKRSWKRDEELYRLRMKVVFGNKRLNQITRQQIQTFHTGLRETGLAPQTGDHHLRVIRHALNLAIAWGMLDENVATRIPLFNVDNRRENYLDETQLANLLQVLQTDANRPVCLIIMFLLSTGCRLNEALSATWANIDRKSRVWRILAVNSKSKRMRSVPLNDSALDVLEQLDSGGKYEHVFVNVETKKPYTTIAKVWNRLRVAAGLPNFRIHDMRHTFASRLVGSGRTLYEVQQILGHSDSKVTERYAHLSSKTLQEAANTASLPIKGAMPAAS